MFCVISMKIDLKGQEYGDEDPIFFTEELFVTLSNNVNRE